MTELVSNRVVEFLFVFPIVMLSLSVHEFAHGWVALLRGDATAKESGRLSINPLAHADLIGTLLLPGICLLAGMPFIGWAKPVPVDIQRMRAGRRDLALVAVAGPTSNFLIAIAMTMVLAGLVRMPADTAALEYLQTGVVLAIQINLALGVFNLLPLPPLDGFNILQGVLPLRMVIPMLRYSRVVSLVLFAAVLFGGLQFLAVPITYLFRSLILWIE